MNTFAADLEGTLTTGETWPGMAAWMQVHGWAERFQWFFYRNLQCAVAERMGRGDKWAF